MCKLSEEQKTQLEIDTKRFIEEEKQWNRGQPSSKIGRDIYYSSFGFFDCFSVIREWFADFMNGTEVWYSESGHKHRRIPFTKRS